MGKSWAIPAHLSASVRDLWKAKDLGQFKDKILHHGRSPFSSDAESCAIRVAALGVRSSAEAPQKWELADIYN